MNNLPSAQDSKFNVARISMHDRTTTHKALFISCNELLATVPSECDFELNVARILMHEWLPDEQRLYHCVILISLKYCWRQGQPIASLVAMRLARR